MLKAKVSRLERELTKSELTLIVGLTSNAPRTLKLIHYDGKMYVLLHGDETYFKALENIYGQLIKESADTSPLLALKEILAHPRTHLRKSRCNVLLPTAPNKRL